MWRSIAHLTLIVGAVLGCEYGRTPGLFKHGFNNVVGTDNFVADDGGDDTAGIGGKAQVILTTPITIFGLTGLTHVLICDNGYVRLGSGDLSAAACVTQDTALIGIGHTLVTPLLFAEKASVEYRFKYKQLKASDLDDGLNGLDIGPSRCDMQRMQNIIGDCPDDEERDGTTLPTEMLIVTWEIKDVSGSYYFQLVLSVTGATSHVAFLYEGVTTIADFKSGFLIDNGNNFAGVCPYTDTDYAGVDLHEQSNCRCGSWNKGIYLFDTSSGPKACSKGTLAEFQAQCALDITTDNTVNMEMACRPSRNLQDTCLETVFCRDLGTSGKEINIKVHNPPFTTNTAVTFVDASDFESGTVTQKTDASCTATLTHNTTFDYYEWTTTLADLATCDLSETGGEVEFVTRVYDSTDPDIDKAGVIYMKATCDMLPSELSVVVNSGSVLASDITKGDGRRLVMFFNNHRHYTFTDDSTEIPAAAVVHAGQDLYLAIGYDYGTIVPVDGIDPYGIYAYDCKVSNNALFDTTGDNKVIQLTTAGTGCIATTLTADKAFYMEESFKCNIYATGALSKSGVSDTDGATYNYVITAAKFDAAKWLIGGSDKIYAQCKVGFCRNQAFAASSRCADTCGTTNVDYNAGRKRRNANETEFEDPEITVQTSVTLIDGRGYHSPRKEADDDCISNVIAYSTLVALTVLLLVAMGITLMLFARLHARQRKRV